MCFAFDGKNSYLTKKREDGLEFHITRLSVLIPLLVSAAVFFVEIYSKYYGIEDNVNCLEILRLVNTTFIPTHIATTAVFLYQHFSLSNNFDHGGRRRLPDDMEIKTGSAGLTMMITIFFAFFYVLFSFKVSLWNQILLVVMQIAYMFVLIKYGISEKIVRYGNSIKNVVSY